MRTKCFALVFLLGTISCWLMAQNKPPDKRQQLAGLSNEDLSSKFLESAGRPKIAVNFVLETGTTASFSKEELRAELIRRGLFDALMLSEEISLKEATNQALLDAFQEVVENGYSDQDTVQVSIPSKPAVTVRVKALRQVLHNRGLL